MARFSSLSNIISLYKKKNILARIIYVSWLVRRDAEREMLPREAEGQIS
jgi:hypothetical protein